MGTIGVFNVFNKSPKSELHKTVGKSKLQSQKKMQWIVNFKMLYNGCIMLRFKGYPNLDSYFKISLLVIGERIIKLKESNLFLLISQVQGLSMMGNFTIATNVFNVFHKYPRNKWPKTGHIMDPFPVLGTVTHMVRFPLDENFVSFMSL